jgi:hypothetical protein
MLLRLARRQAARAVAAAATAARVPPRGLCTLRTRRAGFTCGDAASRLPRHSAAAEAAPTAASVQDVVEPLPPPLFAPGMPRVLVFVSGDSGPRAGHRLTARLRAAVGAAQARAQKPQHAFASPQA